MRKLALGALVVLLLAVGCWGYRAGNLFREDIRTIYVEGFDNRTFRRGLEVPLTRAVMKEIKLRTPLLPAARDQADSILTGELVDVTEHTRVKAERGTILLQRVSLEVRYWWRDRLTGADLVEPRTIVESTQVVTPAVELGAGVDGDPVPADLVPQEAPFEVPIRELAQRLVESMEANW